MPPVGYDPATAAIFTTDSAENLITIKVRASSSLTDDMIGFRISEMNENFTIDPSQVIQTGPTQFAFHASHRTPTAADFGQPGKPLNYKMVAYGEGVPASKPKTLVQEVLSQIRQEYVDARKITGFAVQFQLPVPERADFIDGPTYNSQYPNRLFPFQDFAKGSHFSPKVTIIGQSVQIAERCRSSGGTRFVSAPPGEILARIDPWGLAPLSIVRIKGAMR